MINLVQKTVFPNLLKSVGGFGRVKAKNYCPVVAVTAHHSDDVIEKCKKVEMKDTLFKPVSMDKLKSTLTKFYY